MECCLGLAAAPQVVRYLQSLGVRDEDLGGRVVSIFPELLTRSVDAHLKPCVQLLMALGVQVG